MAINNPNDPLGRRRGWRVEDGSGFVADAAQSIEIRCRPVEARDEQIVELATASSRKASNRPASGMRWIASENR